MWVLQFWGCASSDPLKVKFGLANANFSMTPNAAIAYWVICTTQNTCVVFQFKIVLDVDISI
jgi:hypothetical protein